MRFILFIILIIAISALAEQFLPWWMIAVSPFVVSLFMKQRGGMSFLAGFIGIAVFWFVAVLIKDIPNSHILSQKMAVLFHLADYGLLICVVALLGGIVGGLSAWSGSLMGIRK